MGHRRGHTPYASNELKRVARLLNAEWPQVFRPHLSNDRRLISALVAVEQRLVVVIGEHVGESGWRAVEIQPGWRGEVILQMVRLELSAAP